MMLECSAFFPSLSFCNVKKLRLIIHKPHLLPIGIGVAAFQYCRSSFSSIYCANLYIQLVNSNLNSMLAWKTHSTIYFFSLSVFHSCLLPPFFPLPSAPSKNKHVGTVHLHSCSADAAASFLCSSRLYEQIQVFT